MRLPKENIARFAKWMVLIAVMIVSLYPVIWIILGSLKGNDELMLNTWGLPREWRFSNYAEAWLNSGISRAFINSLMVSCGSLLILIIVSTMAAFALTRLRFKGSKLVRSGFMVIMMIPLHVTLIPLFLSMTKMNLNNTYFSLILPYVTFGLPVAIFILTGFLKAFPDSIEESAVIDGASMIRVFFTMTVPMSKPSIATVAIYSFVTMWNELLYAVVFMSKKSMMTIPVVLTMFKGQYTTDYVSMLAAIVMGILPSLLIYVFFNRQIIAGMASGAVKG